MKFICGKLKLRLFQKRHLHHSLFIERLHKWTPALGNPVFYVLPIAGHVSLVSHSSEGKRIDQMLRPGMKVCSYQKHHLTAYKPNSFLCCRLGEQNVFPHRLPVQSHGPPLSVKARWKHHLCSYSVGLQVHVSCILVFFRQNHLFVLIPGGGESC